MRCRRKLRLAPDDNKGPPSTWVGAEKVLPGSLPPLQVVSCEVVPCEVVPTRVNYSSGELLIRLSAAVEDWLGKKGQYSIFSSAGITNTQQNLEYYVLYVLYYITY